MQDLSKVSKFRVFLIQVGVNPGSRGRVVVGMPAPVAGGHLHTVPGCFGAMGGVYICVCGNSVQQMVVPSKH